MTLNPYALASLHAPMYLTAKRSGSGRVAQLGAVYKKVGFRSLNGSYMQAVNGGGGAVTFNPNYQSSWETFVLVNRSGDTLNSGDKIQLVTNDLNHYVTAEGGGGRELVADRSNGSIWETFGIFKIAGPGPILNGDKVALQTYNGKYVQAINGGGAAAAAGADNISTWETFTISIQDATPPATTPEPAAPSTEPATTNNTASTSSSGTVTDQSPSLVDSIVNLFSPASSMPASSPSQSSLLVGGPSGSAETSFLKKSFNLFGVAIPYYVPIAGLVGIYLLKKRRR